VGVIVIVIVIVGEGGGVEVGVGKGVDVGADVGGGVGDSEGMGVRVGWLVGVFGCGVRLGSRTTTAVADSITGLSVGWGEEQALRTRPNKTKNKLTSLFAFTFNSFQ
jgi:hypothetical protein